jgi:hypothetical protein
MKITRGLAIILAAIVASPASAAWFYKEGEDPLNDDKYAYIAEGEKGGGYNPFLIGVKCWEGKPDSTTLLILTPAPYDQSAEYKEEVEVILRVDKGDKQTINMGLGELSGKVVLSIRQDDNASILPLVRAIGSAKQQIVVGINNQVRTFSVTGSGKAVDKLMKTCRLDATS